MKKYDPKIHHRRSIRLKGYDYARPGLYFVTIVVKYWKCLFGEIINGEMIPNDAGKMVDAQWLAIPERFPNVRLHEYVVMPNHFHGIVELVDSNSPAITNGSIERGDDPFWNEFQDIDEWMFSEEDPEIHPEDFYSSPSQQEGNEENVRVTLGDIVGAFQSIVTVEYIRGVKNSGWPPFIGKLWHRNYWDYIIRNERIYTFIANYIKKNPANWNRDKFRFHG